MHYAKLISHLNNKTHLTLCEKATLYYTNMLFYHSNHADTLVHEGRTSRWLDSTAALSREDDAIFFVGGHHHYARYISWHLRDMHWAHSTWCKAGSPQWFTRLPSHRMSCCDVRGPIRRADVYQAGENKPATEWHINQPWTSRRLDRRVCSHLAMAIDGMYNSNAGPATAATTVKHKE